MRVGNIGRRCNCAGASCHAHISSVVVVCLAAEVPTTSSAVCVVCAVDETVFSTGMAPTPSTPTAAADITATDVVVAKTAATHETACVLAHGVRDALAFAIADGVAADVVAQPLMLAVPQWLPLTALA